MVWRISKDRMKSRFYEVSEVGNIAKLSDKWFNAFGWCFKDEEDVIEFIFERLDTSDFEDSYIDCGGHGEPNEHMKQSASDKRELLYDFMMELIDKK